MEKGCEGFGVGSGRWSGRGWGGRKKRGNRDELERNEGKKDPGPIPG